MLRKLLLLLTLTVASQTATAWLPGDMPLDKREAEPNWETAEHSCPEVITSRKGEHRFYVASVYGYSLRYGKWNYIVPEAREHIRYTFEPEKEQAYLFCHYNKLDTALIIHAKDAIACNDKKGVCWKADPYVGKKR